MAVTKVWNSSKRDCGKLCLLWALISVISSSGGFAWSLPEHQNTIDNGQNVNVAGRIRRAASCTYPGMIEGSSQIRPDSGAWISDSCDPKVFYTVGDHTRMCQDDGDWTAPPPICVHKAFAGPVVREVMFDGRMVTTTCTAVLGKHPDCNRKMDGETTNSLPVSSCSDPVKENYKVTKDTRVSSFVPGVEYDVQCQDGFRPEGATKITCKGNSKWDPQPPNCVSDGSSAVTPATAGPVRPGGLCTDPGPIQYGDVKLDREMSKASYTCQDGYIKDGVDFRSCLSGLWNSESPKCIECGRVPIQAVPSHQIAAGTPSSKGQWPWMVAILREDTEAARQSCGGSLINKNWVVTAAHCMVAIEDNRLTNDPAPLQYFVAMLGKHFRSRLSEGRTQVHQLSRLILHPGFDSKTLHHDIALLKLSTQAEFTDWVQPICLPNPADFAEQNSFKFGSTGYVIGWGFSNDTHLLEVLNHVVITVRPTSFCDRNNITRLNFNMFCAGDSISEKAVCKGDSGGPFAREHPVNSRWILEGIVSFKLGTDCGTVTFYTVFTRVEKYLDWIYKIMQENQ